jgi:predicted component of type VI protein secretion system
MTATLSRALRGGFAHAHPLHRRPAQRASEDKTVSVTSWDIFNPFFTACFQCLDPQPLVHQAGREKDAACFERLFCLLGLGLPELRTPIRQPERFLRYIGLFSQLPRSGTGLKTLLADWLEEPSVDVIEMSPGWWAFRRSSIACSAGRERFWAGTATRPPDRRPHGQNSRSDRPGG